MVVAPAPREKEPAPPQPVPPPAREASAEPSPPAARAAEPAPTLDEYEASCFVKIDGRVLVSKTCRILREREKSVVFEIDEGPLTLDYRQGRTWTARLAERDIGNVYKTGNCWGAHGFYACDRGRK